MFSYGETHLKEPVFFLRRRAKRSGIMSCSPWANCWWGCHFTLGMQTLQFWKGNIISCKISLVGHSSYGANKRYQPLKKCYSLVSLYYSTSRPNKCYKWVGNCHKILSTLFCVVIFTWPYVIDHKIGQKNVNSKQKRQCAFFLAIYFQLPEPVILYHQTSTGWHLLCCHTLRHLSINLLTNFVQRQ